MGHNGPASVIWAPMERNPEHLLWPAHEATEWPARQRRSFHPPPRRTASSLRLEEANELVDQLLRDVTELDAVSYNRNIDLRCKESEFEYAYQLLDELEKGGLGCDIFTHSTIVDGLCKTGDSEGALRHFKYIYGFFGF
ncbi:hypothetical protein CDL15_Pgr013725 [Punica granatum]|uniref:Pentatricopeptide repeat-containing protein n=1 Tax=Punica granatum TaxID=22663 RepID=A0A218W216_PUNGR|nr:hypothetical protein CDL15_Pgr013725 [Punica granatum]PKI67329.1 hypothetical protein CRG98_012278 [Punica granatum]